MVHLLKIWRYGALYVLFCFIRLSCFPIQVLKSFAQCCPTQWLDIVTIFSGCLSVVINFEVSVAFLICMWISFSTSLSSLFLHAAYHFICFPWWMVVFCYYCFYSIFIKIRVARHSAPSVYFFPFGTMLCCKYCGTIIWILCVWDKDIVKSCDMDGEEV